MEGSTAAGKRYRLENAMETAVKLQVEHQIAKDPEMCRCEKCYLDVCAIVFNSGFTKFVTSEMGGLLANLDNTLDGRDVELMVAILNAIKVVKKRPEH